jgi:hypothetical protein
LSQNDARCQKLTSPARTSNDGALSAFFEIDLPRTTELTLSTWFANLSFSLPAIQDQLRRALRVASGISIPFTRRYDRSDCFHENEWRYPMGFGKGALLWLLGIPLPIIILLAIFMHH